MRPYVIQSTENRDHFFFSKIHVINHITLIPALPVSDDREWEIVGLIREHHVLMCQTKQSKHMLYNNHQRKGVRTYANLK